MPELVVVTPNGLFCPPGGFYIDPWAPAPGSTAVITHAHSDHARLGAASYVTSASGAAVLRTRLGENTPITPVSFAERRTVGDVVVSLHPAGHILGSAQIRIEHKGEVWVVSGDYKIEPDVSCEHFEPVRCNVFITESTFALPIYRWPDAAAIARDINAWWSRNAGEGVTSILFAYAVGKAQRLLAALDPTIGPILVHGAVNRFLPAYEAAGTALPPTMHADRDAAKAANRRAIVIAPPSADATPWLRKFGDISRAFASGWMRIRGTRRRRNIERGFVLSDHADWPGLLKTISDTGAERIGVTHGYTAPFVRWLREHGREAWEVPTRFVAEAGSDDQGFGPSAATSREDAEGSVTPVEDAPAEGTP